MSSVASKALFAILLLLGGVVVFFLGYGWFSGHKVINSTLLVLVYFGIFGRGMESIKEFTLDIGRRFLASLVFVAMILLLIGGVYLLLKIA